MKPELGTDAINAIVYSQYSPGLADFFESFRSYLSRPEMIRLGNYIANDLLRELKYHETPLDFFQSTEQRYLWATLALYAVNRSDKMTTTKEIRGLLEETDDNPG
jgi:hypothetical protein